MKSWKNINKRNLQKIKTTTKKIGIKFDNKNLILFLRDGKQLNKVFLGQVLLSK